MQLVEETLSRFSKMKGVKNLGFKIKDLWGLVCQL